MNETVRDKARVAAALLVSHVRSYLRDYPTLNRLVAGVESSDRMIARAIDLVISDWNTTPPLIGNIDVRAVAQPGGPLSAFVLGTVAELLTQVAILQDRNDLPYTDGQFSVRSSAKSAPYQRIAGGLREKYETQKRQYKIAKNIEGGWGTSISSDYAVISVIEFY